MTTQIDRDDSFLGLPMTRLKALLQLFENGTRNPDALGRSSKLGFSRSLVTAMIGECRERGLVSFDLPTGAENGPRKWRRASLTPAGKAVTAASAMKRATKDAASEVLEDILHRAQALSHDDKAPVEAKKIWVFGSFIDATKTDVGDLDIVVEEHRKSEFIRRPIREVVSHIDKHYPGVVPQSLDSFHAEGHFFRRMIYGAKKHPLVSPCDIHILIALHRPCRLVFDSERGGLIQGEDYDHHPSSTKRGNNIYDRLVMPDLKTIPEVFSFTPAEVASATFWGGRPEEEVVLSDNADVPTDVRGAVGDIAFDGCGRFGVLIRPQNGPPLVLSVERAVRFEPSNWMYDCKITIHTQENRPSLLDPNALKRASEVIGDLFNADVLRLADRRDQLGIYPEISAGVTVNGPCKKLISAALESRVFELGHYTDDVSVSPRHEYGLDLEINNETGGGFAPICSYDANDWLEMSPKLPFTETQYNDWLRKNDPVQFEEMLFFASSASDNAAAPRATLSL
jgi:hypothetical protein